MRECQALSGREGVTNEGAPQTTIEKPEIEDTTTQKWTFMVGR